MLPRASISHRTSARARIRIPDRRRDAAFFDRLQAQFAKWREWDRLDVNPLTGTVLLAAPALDVPAVARFAGEARLFDLPEESRAPAPMARQVAAPVERLSADVRRFTGGDLDLPGALFVALCGYGIVQLLRGNFKAPPWYTAFWYAFGIFTKSILDRSRSAPPDAP